MAQAVVQARPRRTARGSHWVELIRKEDWWAIWIGLGLIAVAVAVFTAGASIKWLSVAPQKWSRLPGLIDQLHRDGLRYASLFLLWAVLFGVAAAALGIRLSKF